MSDTAASSDPDIDATQVLDALRPRRRARPRLAAPLHEARDGEVPTPFGPVMAWRLDPWGSSGASPATLLVHGWEDDNALWGPLIDQLQALGRPVVALDLPGHGFSRAEECSIGRAAAALQAVADAFGPIDSLVAHSFGCPAAVRAMADGLLVERAVLMATPLPSARLGARWSRVKEAMGLSDAMVERVQALAAEREAIFPPFDYPALAARMTARALLIHSLDDDDCDPENSRLIADAWGVETGARAGLQWTEGLGHRLLAQDAATLAGVAAFIEHG
jgi:pimeloyl-ACP methyl ester carboxylesterase